MIPAVLAGISGRAVLCAAAVATAVLAALCWILADAARSANLVAGVLTAARDIPRERAPGQAAITPSDRPAKLWYGFCS